jgi:hypothetical protein
VLGISVNLNNSAQIFKLEKKSRFIMNEEVRLYFSEKNRAGKLWKGYILVYIQYFYCRFIWR